MKLFEMGTPEVGVGLKGSSGRGGLGFFGVLTVTEGGNGSHDLDSLPQFDCVRQTRRTSLRMTELWMENRGQATTWVLSCELSSFELGTDNGAMVREREKALLRGLFPLVVGSV